MNNIDTIIKLTIDESIDEIMAYHGTVHDFDKFDTAYMGTGTGHQDFGWGIYLSLAKEGARDYGNILYEVEIPSDDKKFIHAEKLYKKTFCNKLIRAIYRKALSEEDSPWIGSEREFYDELMRTFGNGVYGDCVLGSITPYIGGYNGESSDEAAAKLLRSLGYFGYKWRYDNITNVVMFDAKDIHVVGKTKY